MVFELNSIIVVYMDPLGKKLECVTMSKYTSPCMHKKPISQPIQHRADRVLQRGFGLS